MTDETHRMSEEDRLRTHYELEKKLARRIMDAAPAQRSAVSLAAYNELFRTITWHDGWLATEDQRARLAQTYAPFARLVGRDADVLEIGCGNGAQLRELAARNRHCVGVDISAEVLNHRADMPGNVELKVADAVDLAGLVGGAFDVVLSSQLIEHLHPDDLPRHLAETARVLRPGGRYVLETPHRLTGPHDVSRHFDDVATCFHLREYTVGELVDLMRAAGFSRFRSPLFRHAMYGRWPRLARAGEIPATWKRPLEALVGLLPGALRRPVAQVCRLDTILLEAWTPAAGSD